jgi:RHS repeat-associated protein
LTTVTVKVRNPEITHIVKVQDLENWLNRGCKSPADTVITDANGNIEQQYYYYPYGGLVSSVGGDPNHYKFTGKERDSESGLDNFGARYNASSMGRFMTPDPLLNSGRPGSPQTWNRYTYALNNPLKIVDPTGLYNVACGSDKQCLKAASDLKNGLSDLQKKADKMKNGDQKTRLENSLKAMGTQNDGNNVNVSFGATKGGGAGETVPVSDPQTYKESYNVTLDPSKLNGSNDYAIAGAHEGTHVDDISSELANPSLGVLSDFSLEYRGYQTSAFAASALGRSTTRLMCTFQRRISTALSPACFRRLGARPGRTACSP